MFCKIYYKSIVLHRIEYFIKVDEVDEVHRTTSSIFSVVYPDKYTPFSAKLKFG